MARRLRKIAVVLASVFLGPWALWIVGANAALWAAPRMIAKREPIAISFKAYTLIPAVIHVRDFHLRVEDRWLQWSVEARSGTARVDISSLFRRTFHARKVTASGVRFRLRTKKTDAELAKLPAHAYPAITGFEPAPLREDARFPEGKPLVAPWKIQMDDVTAQGEDIWVEGVRYEGKATATGRWGMKFDRAVDVGPVELALNGGSVRFRSEPVAHALSGQVRGGLRPFNPREIKDGGIIDQLRVFGSIQGMLAADVAKRPATNEGSFDATIDIDRGVLRPGTALTATVPSARTRFGALHLRGDVHAKVRVTEARTIAWSAEATALRLTLPTKAAVAVDARRATVTASSAQTELRRLELPAHANVELPAARVADLRSLNAFIPDPFKLRIQAGSGHVSAKLRVNVQQRSAKGRVLVRAQSIALKQDDRELKGTLALRFDIARAAPELERISLTAARASFENMTDGSNARPWNGFVDLSNATVDTRRKEVLRGHVTAHFENARPLFREVVDQLDIPGWARGAITPNNVDAQAELALGKGLVQLRDVNARVGRVDVKTRLRLSGQDQRGVAELSMGKLRVGVERVGRRTHVKPFAHRNWYAEKSRAAKL